MTDLWSTVAAERGALADDLADLTDSQWAMPSLCSEWTVREALAHMTSTAQTTPGGFAVGIVKSGFRFDAFVDRQIKGSLGDSAATTLANFRSAQHSTKAPPGPKTSWLGETIVHAEDIRRALDITHAYPMDAVRQVADFFKNSNTLIGSKNRIKGLRLEATDTDWTHGSGAVASGPMLSLLLAMTGRKAAVADLLGPGSELLRQRN